MTPALAFLGDFGDALSFIFHSRRSGAGAVVGGSHNLPLLWTHLQLTGVSMALALAIAPILTNAYVGVRQVDRDAVDAARGMGLSGAGILRSIELPLALPLIFGGIKTSTVNVIATATIAPLAGVVTLGDPLTAFAVYHREGQIGASIIVAVLAIVAEVGLSAVQRAVTPTGIKLERGAEGRARARFGLTKRRIQTAP